MHIHVHGADGNALPTRTTRWYTWGVRNGTARTGGIVPGANARGIRGKDGITSSIKVEQCIKRRVPGAVGPDIVEDAVIEDAVTAADGHLAFAKGIPGKADARAKVMVLRFPHAVDRAHPCRRDAGRIKDAAIQICKLRDIPVNLARRAKPLPAKPEIQGQAAGSFPVILSEHGIIMTGVVAVSVGLIGSGNARVNGCFLKPRVIVGEV